MKRKTAGRILRKCKIVNKVINIHITEKKSASALNAVPFEHKIETREASCLILAWAERAICLRSVHSLNDLRVVVFILDTSLSLSELLLLRWSISSLLL